MDDQVQQSAKAAINDLTALDKRLLKSLTLTRKAIDDWDFKTLRKMLAAAAENLRDELWHATDANRQDAEVIMPQLALERFGATGRKEILKFFETGNNSSQCPIIMSVTDASLVGLLEELVKLHGRAYDWNADLNVGELLQGLGSHPIRTYIRATLEALDIRYLYQEEVVPKAEDLVASALEEDESFFSEAAENE